MLDRIIGEIGKKELFREAGREADSYQNNLIKPKGSLGMLEDISIRLAEMTGDSRYRIDRKRVVLFAADHGFARHGVSAYPTDVTKQMTMAYLKGTAGANVVAEANGAVVAAVVDMGIDGEIRNPLLLDRKIRYGTSDFTKGPAMSAEEAEKAVLTGYLITEGVINGGADIIAPGEMGIGNTTSSSALLAVFSGISPEESTGRGSMINDETWRRKADIVKKAIEVNRPDPAKPLETLAKVGGFEIAAMTGVYLACANNRIPVVVDGFIAGAAALTAKFMAPGVEKFMFASHRSAEVQHRHMLEMLGLEPIIDLRLRLGEASGASIAMQIIDTASKVICNMDTFETAGVRIADSRLEMELDKISR